MLRLFVVGGVVLTLIYVCLAMYCRSVCLERLEKEWDAGDGQSNRDDYVAAGFAEYQRSFRKKLLLLVYIVPVVTVTLIIYLTNHN